jgi:Rps23 Pro-64 3,4-dihydroxylase Tpa1-like proline 4-hydroxylase
MKLFTHYKNQYCHTYKIIDHSINVSEIQLLTYPKGNFYKTHIDHFRSSPRTLSIVFLVNDNYEGGELCFELFNETIKIPKKQNSLIIWPSNFQYPHKVLPVSKGERYSIVSWAL